MTTIRFSEVIETKLDQLALITKRSKSFFVKEAVEKYLEDMEDTYIALDRMANPSANYISTENLLSKLESRDNKDQII